MSKDNLCIKRFNDADILLNGESIFKDKQLTAKLKSLLQYFLINHSTPCTPEDIIKNLWEDSNYSKRKKILQTYVYRLRNAFNGENNFDRDFSEEISIVNIKGNYIFEVADNVIFDTDIFEDLVEKTEAIEDTEKLLEMNEKLKEVYDGHFMETCTMEKLVSRQKNYYLQLYSGAVSHILNQLNKEDDYDKIIDLSEDFFEIDDLDTAINTVFLKTLITTGQLNYAMNHYTYLEHKYRATYGVGVPEELTEIIQDELSSSLTTRTEESEELDRANIESFIESMVSKKLKSSQIKYAFASISLKNNGSKEDILTNVLENSLRKNDMYTVIDSNNAIVLLYEAQEENYNIIINRITNFINQEYHDKNISSQIHIWPVTNII